MADFQKDVTVLGARRMDFKNGADEIKGVQVWYYTDSVREENTVGIIPNKAWLTLDEFKVFQQVEEYPAVSDCGMNVDMAKGKLKPITFSF